MDDIELSSQSSRGRSYTVNDEDQHSSVNNIYKDNDEVTATSIQMPRRSTEPSMSITDVNQIQPKKSALQKLKTMLPPLPIIRTVLKATVAILIGTLFVFVDRLRAVVGQASLLVPIASLILSPTHTIGAQLEMTIYCLFGALAGSAWCILGMYLAYLARDTGSLSLIQPAPSAILCVFMLIGVFVFTYARTKFSQATLGCIFAGIITGFALPQAAKIPLFMPSIVYVFLKPLAMAAAITFVVSAVIWPEDSITKYMSVLSMSLKEYNSFFQEHSNAFLSTKAGSEAMTLPSLHARLQGSILKLIDCKHVVQREILLGRISHDDINSITKLVKIMRQPLHGIGLSLMTKSERLNQLNEPLFPEERRDERSEDLNQFLDSLRELRKVSQELTDTCVMTLGECNERLMKFSGRPRSLMSTIFWPFPRIFLSDFFQKKKTSDQDLRLQSLSERLDQVIAKYETAIKNSRHFYIEPGTGRFETEFNSILHVAYVFQFNLKEHASNLRSLVACVESIEATRTKKRLWLPRLKLRKWFRSLNISATIGTQTGSAVNGTDSNGNSGLGNDLTISQNAEQLEDLDRQEDLELVYRRNRYGKVYPRDPDVNPPETAMENFFYGVKKALRVFKSMEAIFAFKTAAGFTLISLPAFLPQSNGWFTAWSGQWATFTLMMWMFPMAGMFFFTVVLRVAGTVLGGVLAIIVWEMVRGNPYGLAIMTCVVSIPLFYVFFNKPVINIVAMMTHVTYIMVICYEYQYKTSGAATYDSVEMIAGKRMLLVIIGVAAAAILSLIPRPVTGRKELRKRISRTLHDIGKLYGILMSSIIIAHDDDKAEFTGGHIKAFRKLILGIYRQIADEQTYVKISKLEPPLSGKFPVEEYTKLVEKVDNMVDLIHGMAFAHRSIDKAWGRRLALIFREERLDYIASMLAVLKLMSTTLSSKVALPPFMLSPIDLGERIKKRLSTSVTNHADLLDNDTFPSLCAYSLNSNRFARELSEALVCVENLVGIEDPEQWLLVNA